MLYKKNFKFWVISLLKKNKNLNFRLLNFWAYVHRSLPGLHNPKESGRLNIEKSFFLLFTCNRVFRLFLYLLQSPTRLYTPTPVFADLSLPIISGLYIWKRRVTHWFVEIAARCSISNTDISWAAFFPFVFWAFYLGTEAIVR